MDEKELITALEEYIKLLNAELEEVIVLAHVHGWESHRYEEGKKCRERIERAKKSPPRDASPLPPEGGGRGEENRCAGCGHHRMYHKERKGECDDVVEHNQYGVQIGCDCEKFIEPRPRVG